MTFKIERIKARRRWTLRLIGALRSDDLEEIARELAYCGPGAALDLAEVTVVGVDVIRFLAGTRETRHRVAPLPTLRSQVDRWRRR
jgi:hypothetical protein